MAVRVFLPVCFPVLLLAQPASGPRMATFRSEVDNSDQPYALYVPKSLDRRRQYPLVISLHEEGSDHQLNLRRLFGKGRLPREADTPWRDVDYIVACPYARGSMGYQGIPEQDVYAVLAEVKRRFPIDDNRVYLAGIAMGGGGALWLGLTRPDTWAAVAAVAPSGASGSEDLAPNSLNLPVRLFHGEQDPAIPVEQSRQWQKRFLDFGVNVEYIEYLGVRHNAWDYAYKDAAIFDWFAKFRRAEYPERVRFRTRAYKYDAAYWVRLDSFLPGEPASIDARFTARNQLAISTQNLDGFTLRLAGHPRFSPALPLVAAIDGAPVRVRAAATISFRRGARGWRTGREDPAPGEKRKGAEGPIPEAIASRQIYVYGMADAPAADELRRRQEIAWQASAWSQPDARLMLSFAVMADGQVNAQDLESSNLLLFGTKETNSLIARFARQLPLALNPGAADYGLVFVAPAGGHYVVVNSGLPWWTGADQVKRPEMHGRMLAPFRVLETFGDFVLFKGSLENVIAEGRFDRHWKLPAAAAAKMRETGTVVIQ
jgi:hypothetical protein